MKRFFLPLALLLLLAGCGGSGTWGWYVIDPTTPAGWTNIKFLISGMGSTILISVIAAAISIVLGLIVALPGQSSNRWLRLINRVYVEFIRSIPLLPMLFWVFYGLPIVFRSMGLNIPIDPFWGAIITLALSDSAFTAEIYRSGIQSIARGQTEAAQTIGLTYTQTMRYVVLPQALGVILPPLTNQMLSLIKESAILSTITVQEMTMTALRIQGETFRPFEAFIMIALLYWLLNEVVAIGMRRLERRFTQRTRRAAPIKIEASR